MQVIKKKYADSMDVNSVVENAGDATLSRAEVSVRIRDILTTILVFMSGENDVSVEITHGEKTTIFKVNCSQKSIGKIIGAQGKNIGALRTLVASLSGRNGFRSIVEVPYYPFDSK